MKNKLLLLLTTLMLSSVSCFGHRTHIYRGNSHSQFDIICTIDGNQIYRGNSYLRKDIICTIRNSKIYRGCSYNNRDLICFVDYTGDVYQSELRNRNSLLFTVNRGRLFFPYHARPDGILAGRRFYTGQQQRNLLFRADGDINQMQLIAVLSILSIHT